MTTHNTLNLLDVSSSKLSDEELQRLSELIEKARKGCKK
jgi:hypothetical protein